MLRCQTFSVRSNFPVQQTNISIGRRVKNNNNRVNNQYAEFDRHEGKTLVEGGGKLGKGKVVDSRQMKDIFWLNY